MPDHFAACPPPANRLPSAATASTRSATARSPRIGDYLISQACSSKLAQTTNVSPRLLVAEFHQEKEFLASPRLLASHLLWKQKEDSIMARPLHASGKLVLQTFEPLSATCLACGNAAHIAYHTQWTVTTLTGRHHLHLAVRRCTSPECPRYHRPYRLGSQREHGHYHTGNTDWT